VPRARKRSALPPAKSLGQQVRRCHLRFDRMLTARLVAHDLNSGYWYYLRALWTQDGQTQGELSKVAHVADNTTTAMINSMIKQGLVQRVRDPEDGRRARIYLTDRGRALEAELLHYGIEINAIATRGIARQEVQTCLSVLARAAANLQRAFEPRRATDKRQRGK